MAYSQFYTFLLLLFFSFTAQAQIIQAYDDFEGNSNIPRWAGDDCVINIRFANPLPEGINTSSNVLRYDDTGGQYANVRFDMNGNFDFSTNQTFSIKIFIPSGGITGNQRNQVSLKLQDGTLPQPWVTQSEIIKPVELDTWQTVTFDFEKDNYINLDSRSLPPVQRKDFNRVLIQVNGENNNDRVIAYIDDIRLFQSEVPEPIFTELVWSDEFDIEGAIDSEKWFHQTRLPDGNSWYNGEIQHYTDRIENAYVEDGVLHLMARKETYTNQGVTKDYTSARLNSKFSFTYGRIDIRTKLPTGVGTWPALWMLGKNITEPGAYWETQGYGTTPWPQCGEIDIMEHWGDNQDYISSAIHTPSSFGNTVNLGGRILPNASTEFHVYSVIWTEENIEFQVDGLTHYVYEPAVKNGSTWPFDADQYILFNIAILPIIDPNFTESAMEVDYIRIYQERTVTDLETVPSRSDKVLPNPFRDTFTIIAENPSDSISAIQLLNAQGSVVRTYPNIRGMGQVTISNTESLPKGMYFLRYEVNQVLHSQQVVKH